MSCGTLRFDGQRRQNHRLQLRLPMLNPLYSQYLPRRMASASAGVGMFSGWQGNRFGVVELSLSGRCQIPATPNAENENTGKYYDRSMR